MKNKKNIRIKFDIEKMSYHSELEDIENLLEEEENLLATTKTLSDIIIDAETTTNRRVDPSIYRELDIRNLHLEIVKIKKILIPLIQRGESC